MALGTAVQGTGIISTGTGITMANPTTWTGTAGYQWDANQHQFNCNKTENGWVFNYRNKSYIASTIDEMMELMKAAMVAERIDK